MLGSTATTSGEHAIRIPSRSTWLGPLIYLAMLVIGVGLFVLIRWAGEGLTAPEVAVDLKPDHPAKPKQVDVVRHVLTTLVAVIAVGFVLGRACRALGQPPVIGEVLAGIVLGPSLLGAISPEAMHALIPSATDDPKGQVSAALKAISQLGIVLYMFVVGLELNAGRLRKQAQAAIAVSHTSILVPFVLGAAMALWLYPMLSHRGVPFVGFALFLGAALAVTAFPVLARILSDRGMEKSDLGIVALGCAAADDVTAWCLLALVVGATQENLADAAGVLTGAVVFIALMFVLVRPLLAKVIHKLDARPGPISPAVVTGAFLLLLTSSLLTEVIGIHAVFGAFLLGVIIPHDSRIAADLSAKIKGPVMVLLLPAFFAYTGMKTEIGLLNTGFDWLVCGVIILVATLGKFGGTLLAARFTGQTWRKAAALGMLMNTRGLMGLIVLDIGLELGVISPLLFAMMVVMALVTTAATAPALQWLASESEPRLNR